MPSPKPGSFIKIPKVLFDDERFSSLTTDSIVLYSLLSDRSNLSKLNKKFQDSRGTFIFYSIKDLCNDLKFGKDKVIKILKQLESLQLITRVRIGQGRNSKIYVHDITQLSPRSYNSTSESAKICETTVSSDKPNSKGRGFRTQEVCSPDISNNKEIKQKKSPPFCTPYRSFESLIKNNIDYNHLQNYYDTELIDSIVSIISDTLSLSSKKIRIGSETYHSELVKQRLLSLDSDHIDYVLDAVKKSKDVISMHHFCLYLLFHSSTSMSLHYSSQNK